MAAFNENNLNDPNENLRNKSQGETGGPDDNLVRGTEENAYPSIKADNPAGSIEQSLPLESDSNREAYGEGSGIWNSWTSSNSTQPGPGDDDDDDLDDDDLLDDDDTLIPIEGDDDDDSLLDTEDDDDIIPGTDMDDGDDLLDDDDDDFDVDDSGVNRSTTGDLGTNISRRDDGRSTGRMIDHEPGTSGI
ncbi:hypothetical protein GZH53_07125 [Flavihumibacter sp. R14]|nr:hypothetical protein [Flavihumibacter soli]